MVGLISPNSAVTTKPSIFAYTTRVPSEFLVRTYPVGMSLNLQWRADRLIYEPAGSNGYEERYIDLPPTYLDWLFARWP